MTGLLITIGAVALAIYLAFLMPVKKPLVIDPVVIENILVEHVSYYARLAHSEQVRFQKEVLAFLQAIKITGAKTDVTDEDRVLVAASAIIPIFSFPGWKYPNLREVLLYPDRFDYSYSIEQENKERWLLGMVGSGHMNNLMILSKPALHDGFKNKEEKNNTGIHEFAHLIDKTDGAVDGIPNMLLGKAYAMPWLQLMHREINAILQNESDINPYGATNEAEFFAVATEYFFERPLLFQQNNPELYAAMQKIFRQEPKTDSPGELTRLHVEG